MVNNTSLLGMARQGRLDIIAGLLGLIAAIALMPLQFLLDQVYIRTLPIVLGCASTLYLLAARDERHGEIATLSFTMARILPPLIILGSAALVVIAGFFEGRTLLFYDIAAAVGTALFAQILFVDNDYFSPGLSLFLIIVFGLVVRFAALYTTTGFIGIDVWTHMGHWTADVLEAQSLQPISDVKYYASPLYHLLVVGSSLLLDVPIRTALFIVVGVAMPISVLLIYATATFFVEPRWAVFATAVYATSASVIEWGIHLIPTSLGLIFFLAIFYSLDRMLRIDYKPRDFGLVVFFSVAVILTHQISAFIMLVFTGSGLLAYFGLGLGIFDIGRPSWERSSTRESVNLTGLLVFDLGLITFMWSLTPHHGNSFLMIILDYFVSTVEKSGVGQLQSTNAQNIPPNVMPQQTLMQSIVEYLDVLGFLLLLLLTIVGCLYIIRQENISHATFTCVIATVIMLMFVFGFPMFGITTFVPGRWYPFVAAPMAVIAAIGLPYLVKNTQPSVMVVVLLLFVVVFPAASILASESTQDQPAFTNTQTRYSYTESELAAMQAIDTYAENKSTNWVTDHPYATAIERTESHNMESGAIQDGKVAGYERNLELQNGTTTTVLRDADTFIYRDYQGSGAAYYDLFYNNASVSYTPKVKLQQVCSGKDILYMNDDVVICDTGGA
ncbi:glycosyltransferase family 39 protein [Halocatena marina]|uniref:glycosyltransferase family 39 protein n=1 Tax=Halocatena marina TaxID=2934937 RepID=UPI002010B379|nr:glycosyltransferase family 39 protein [Halocatena marina]